MNEIVRCHTLDGVWEVGGADRKRGVWPEGLNCVWDKWGPKTARFTLRRDPGAIFPDLTAFTPIEIEKHAKVGWEGFIEDTPEEDDYAVAVQAIGWPDHGDHDPYQRNYVHAKLTDWRDQRSFLEADLTKAIAAGHVEVGDGGIVLGQAKGSTWSNDTIQGVTLDLGPASTALRIVIEIEQTNLNGNGAFVLLTRGTDTPQAHPAAAGFSNGSVLNGGSNQITNGFHAATISPKRYVHVCLQWLGAGGTTGSEHVVRIKAIRVFSATAYESGNQSVLKAHHIFKDGLPFCPLWSQDTSGIDDATSFPFPEFAMTADRPFREVAESVNALHNYVLKLGIGRRLVFTPLPSTPMFVAGPWPGVNFKDASKNSARDIYNTAVGVGVGTAGEQVRVVRHAADQPGGLAPTHDVVHSNPSFDADTAGWTALEGSISRETGFTHTAPGSLRMTSSADSLTAFARVTTSAFSGTWRKGRIYRVRLQLRPGSLEIGSLADRAVIVTLTVGATIATKIIPLSALPNGVFTPHDVFVRPSADTGSATLAVFADATSPLVAALWVDSLDIAESVATIPDRRGFTRAKALSISQAVNSDVMQHMADVWLQSHRRAPLKGDLEIVGPGLRRYQGGTGVDPFDLGIHTGELVHLSSEIDPDTGHVGRDAPIAQVTYNGDEESAQVSLDATRENFEAVVSRYALVAGAGR